MNRIDKLFNEKKNNILNIYFTAGHPSLESVGEIICTLENSGADLIELGMPYSDPLADGTTIQRSSAIALKNGMHLDLLFHQVKSVRLKTQIPIMLMGYFNQLLQYGLDKFLDHCVDSGIDGLIIPDIPMKYYETKVEEKLKTRGLSMTFLITPETSIDRIRQADKLSTAFLYVVSKSSITGNVSEVDDDQEKYFASLNDLELNAPRLIGFGIHDRSTFEAAAKNANGAIIGSAFIRALEENGISGIKQFVSSIKID